MLRHLANILLFFINTAVLGQEIPYARIPDAPAEYNACTISARMIDGLGFRFYWATEGLTEKDVEFQGGGDVRTIGETIEHIAGLASVVKFATLKKANDTKPLAKLTFIETRNQVLRDLKTAADMLRNASPGEMKEFNMIFKRGDSETKMPFWNAINGPIEDAVWHAGQIVLLRRMAGNPVPPKVNYMSGTAGR